MRWACDEGDICGLHAVSWCCSYKRRRLGRRGEQGEEPTLNAHAERRPVWTSLDLAASVEKLGPAASVDQLGSCCVCSILVLNMMRKR